MLHAIIREIMGERTQAEVARAVGVHRSAIHAWLAEPDESGKSLVPSLANFKTFLSFCDPDEDTLRRAMEAWMHAAERPQSPPSAGEAA